MRVVVTASVLLSAAEACWCWPHYLAYFNQLDGGPRQGYRHLVDSSLDWSQELKGVGRWLDGHPADRGDGSLYFSYYGGAPPEYYGISAHRLPSYPDRWQPVIPRRWEAGTYLISATMLQCVMLPYSGRWNQSYETQYQQVKTTVEEVLQKAETAEGQRRAVGHASTSTKHLVLGLRRIAFGRLASYLPAASRTTKSATRSWSID